MQIRMFEASDYPVVCAWWQARKWTPMPLRYLPKNGHVAYDGGKLLAAAWLYLDSTCPLAWLDWLVTNPKNSPKESIKAIHAVIDTLTLTARAMGSEIMMTAVENKKLIKLYSEKGFKDSDKDMTIMINSLMGGK